MRQQGNEQLQFLNFLFAEMGGAGVAGFGFELGDLLAEGLAAGRRRVCDSPLHRGLECRETRISCQDRRSDQPESAQAKESQRALHGRAAFPRLC